MSHSAKIQTKFTQLDALKKAFEHFGWTIKEKSKARTYAYDPAKDTVYDYVAVNNDKSTDRVFDLGINVNKQTGEIDIVGDMWGGSIAKSFGQDLAQLKQEYAFRVIEEKYTYEGASVFRTNNQDGSQTIDVDLP